VKNQYYELVFAQEDVEVKKKSVELAGKLYNDNKRQVEIGTLAPIEVTRAESQLASTRADLIASQTLALQDETLLKQLILRNVMDPKLAEIPVIPTDTPSPNVEVPARSLEDAVKEASEKRPDVRQAMLDLDAKKITTKATRNGLLPSLNLTGQYGAQGLGGNQTTFTTGNPLIAGTNPIVDATGTPILVGGQQVFTSNPTVTRGAVIPGGLGDALSNVFQSNFPNYSIFLNLNIPIRNRTAQAANINAMLLQEQSLATLQKVRNALAVDVHNAKIALEQDKYAVEANIRARILAEQTLDAEQKKFQLGASTIFLVIQAQRDLATARSNEVRSIVNFVEAKVNYDRALGRTLEENRIDVADNSDRLLKSPLIPGTLSGELAGEPAKY
jgi:outer membrane protein TolC